MSKHRDKNNKPLEVGDTVALYQDANEQLFGETPEEYDGDHAVIRELGPSNITARIQFEGDLVIYRVNTNNLVLVTKKPSAPPVDNPAEK